MDSTVNLDKTFHKYAPFELGSVAYENGNARGRVISDQENKLSQLCWEVELFREQYLDLCIRINLHKS
jgi:hypothetical protein